MMPWMKWLYRGGCGLLILLLGGKVLRLSYALLHGLVQWLPRAALAWVPGLDLLWLCLIVILIGRVLSTPTAELWLKKICQCLGRCQCLQYYCARYRQCLGYCLPSSQDTAGRGKYVAFPLPEGKGFAVGSVRSVFVHDGKTWYIIACKAHYPWIAQSLLMFSAEDVTDIEGAFCTQPESGSDSVSEDKETFEEIL